MNYNKTYQAEFEDWLKNQPPHDGEIDFRTEISEDKKHYENPNLNLMFMSFVEGRRAAAKDAADLCMNIGREQWESNTSYSVNIKREESRQVWDNKYTKYESGD